MNDGYPKTFKFNTNNFETRNYICSVTSTKYDNS